MICAAYENGHANEIINSSVTVSKEGYAVREFSFEKKYEGKNSFASFLFESRHNLKPITGSCK